MPPENDSNNNANESLAGGEEGLKKRFALRTLKADTDEFIKTKKISLLDIAAMKEHAKEGKPFVPVAKPSFFAGRLTLFVCVAAAVLIAGAIAYYLIFMRQSSSGISVVTVLPQPIIISQQEKTLNASNINELAKEFANALNSGINPGDLVYLPVKKGGGFITSKAFISILGADTPLSSFLENNFFLGIINLQKKHPVLIFEAKDDKYENIFAGMLQWEKTMFNDLSFLLNKKFDLNPAVTFEDEIIKNYSARMGKYENCSLTYSILNRKYIIITDDQSAMEGLISRFINYKL